MSKEELNELARERMREAESGARAMGLVLAIALVLGLLALGYQAVRYFW